MNSLVGQLAPDFTAPVVCGDNSFKDDFALSSLRGRYVVLFFYPADFTFVCPTEILAFNDRLDDFRARGCEVIGVSTDSKFSHLAWKNTPLAQGGIGAIRYPLVADSTHKISQAYGVLVHDSLALRGTFLIDREGVVQNAVIHNLGLGRSILETFRTLTALQHLEAHGEVCPANWSEGEEAMSPTAEGVANYLGKRG